MYSRLLISFLNSLISGVNRFAESDNFGFKSNYFLYKILNTVVFFDFEVYLIDYLGH